MLITPHCLLSCLAVVVSSSLFVSYLLLGLHVFVCSGNHHGDADATALPFLEGVVCAGGDTGGGRAGGAAASFFFTASVGVGGGVGAGVVCCCCCCSSPTVRC